VWFFTCLAFAFDQTMTPKRRACFLARLWGDSKQGKGKEGEHRRHDIDSEKALLQEMKQMRLQLAQLIDVS
jgi:hypothetical protein